MRDVFSMPVLMIQIWVMRMGMEDRLVRVPMRMQFTRRVRRPVLVLMVQIVGMAVFVLLRQVAVTVFVALC